MRIDATIAIPTFNRARSLADTLRSVRQLTVPEGATCEVLVVDNNSTDDTQDVVAEAARSFPLPVRTVIETRQGLCFGRNRALDEAAGEHVIFLDDDVNVAPEWLVGYQEAVEAVDADCVVGPVFPVFPEDLPPYATKYVLSLIGSDYSRKGQKRHLLPPERAHEVPGCNFGVRRKVAVALGGFDITLGRVGGGLLAGEDTEFGIRLVKAGRRVVYEPQCRIEHLIGADKLNQRYLRNRATGLGRTSARLRAMHGQNRHTRDWMKASKRAVGLLARWQKHRAVGSQAAAFEWELRTRLHLCDLLASVSDGN